MAYTVTVDWISFTLKHDTKEASDVLTYLNPDGIMEPTATRFGYDRAAKNEKGVIFLSSASNPRMGIHAIIPGSALLQLRECGKSASDILSKVFAAKGKVTRLDLAKDAIDERFNLADFEELVSKGNFKGTAQKAASIRSSDGGMTVYIGSRQSERFIRVYDKGVESKRGGDWIRLEIETKGSVANLLAIAIVEAKFDMNAIISSTARVMCEPQSSDWQALLAAEAFFDAPKVEKQSDTEAWINDQVGQAVLNHLDRNPESKAVRRLYELLKARLG